MPLLQGGGGGGQPHESLLSMLKPGDIASVDIQGCLRRIDNLARKTFLSNLLYQDCVLDFNQQKQNLPCHAMPLPRHAPHACRVICAG